MYYELLVVLIGWYAGSMMIAALCPCARLSFVTRDVELPEDMRRAIARIERSSKSKKEFVKKSYQFLSKRFKGYWFPFFLNPASLFWKDLDYLWRYTGVLVCLNLNYIGAQFLINSKFFTEKDVSMNMTFLHWFSYHKFLTVDIGGEKVPFDLWKGKIDL